jgi:hypothetical protein
MAAILLRYYQQCEQSETFLDVAHNILITITFRAWKIGYYNV